MADRHVLVIGLDPDFIDFSAPELAGKGVTAEKIRGGLKGDEDKLNGLGFKAETLLVGDGATAERVVRERLGATRYDVVAIGAGIRTLPPYFLLFEKLINAVHEAAPQAKIAFNTSPADTAEAVKRWV